MNNSQEGPDATTLVEVVSTITYKPGWKLWLAEDMARPTEHMAGSRGLTLCISAEVENSYHPEPTTVEHWMAVPPTAYDRDTWIRWVLDQILLVEQHEALEFFKVDGELVYAPAHGPMRNPYTIERVR